MSFVAVSRDDNVLGPWVTLGSMLIDSQALENRLQTRTNSVRVRRIRMVTSRDSAPFLLLMMRNAILFHFNKCQNSIDKALVLEFVFLF